MQDNLQAARTEQVLEFFQESHKLFARRNQEYGDTIRVGGLIGAAMEILASAARIHQLTMALVLKADHGSFDRVREDVLRDALRDAANYAAIANAMLADGNILGGLSAPGPANLKED